VEYYGLSLFRAELHREQGESNPMSSCSQARKLYVVHTNRGMTIRAATDEDDAFEQVARKVGSDNITDVSEATERDIAWVRGMGGYVPALADIEFPEARQSP
jgi:hypothetical protein